MNQLALLALLLRLFPLSFSLWEPLDPELAPVPDDEPDEPLPDAWRDSLVFS